MIAAKQGEKAAVKGKESSEKASPKAGSSKADKKGSEVVGDSDKETPKGRAKKVVTPKSESVD